MSSNYENKWNSECNKREFSSIWNDCQTHKYEVNTNTFSFQCGAKQHAMNKFIWLHSTTAALYKSIVLFHFWRVQIQSNIFFSIAALKEIFQSKIMTCIRKYKWNGIFFYPRLVILALAMESTKNAPRWIKQSLLTFLWFYWLMVLLVMFHATWFRLPRNPANAISVYPHNTIILIA